MTEPEKEVTFEIEGRNYPIDLYRFSADLSVIIKSFEKDSGRTLFSTAELMKYVETLFQMHN